MRTVAAEKGAPQGGSAGVGSQKAAEAEGEEGAIADGTHLATGHMDVGTVRRKASKQDKKENVLITEMARRVRDWGIDKPQNAQNCVWTWGFKYKNPPKCAAGFQNHALCAICLVDNLGSATVKLGKDNSPSALATHLQYSRAKAVVTFIHKSSQVPVAFFGWYMHVRVYLVLFPLYTIY